MIRPGIRDDLPALRALFGSANDGPYDLARVAEEKCFGEGIGGAPQLRVIENHGAIQAAAVFCGKWLRILVVARDARRTGLGSALLAEAESRGVTIIAAEPGNYFTPGVVTTDANSRRFLLERGFAEGPSTQNLEVTPGAFDDAETVRRPPHAEKERVLAFIEREFGRIWQFEASKAFDRETPPLFVTEENDSITGFAAHDVNNRGLGFFGPTGVAKAMRGRGLGCALLRASLADLKRLGFTRVVIPWTDAIAFYDRCSGAEPAHQFVAFAKRRT